VLGCFGLTEPDHGSNPADLRATAAARPGGGWRIDGRKVFITNGSIAGVALVMARSGGPGAKGVSAFLVPTDRPGFTANAIHGKLGLRSCDTAELVLDGVEVGADALLGGEGDGLKVALSALDDGRMSISASCTGVSQAALETMIRYAGAREQFGKPIAGHQLVAAMIADSAVDVDASRLLTWAVADLKTRGERYSLAASKAKLFATEASVRVANNCIQVHGGYGYVDEYPAAKFLRDARVTTLYEGTSQIQQLLIGRALTGISAF
jgi:alkylation response protein AidB-like acyl-CoA dehydrogenase